jgi:hypothetical protein
VSDEQTPREQILQPGNYASIPHSVLTSQDLTPADKLVYVALLDRLGKNEIVWPSQQTVGRDTGLGLRTVRRSIGRLLEIGVIQVNVRRGRSAAVSFHPTPGDLLENPGQSGRGNTVRVAEVGDCELPGNPGQSDRGNTVKVAEVYGQSGRGNTVRVAGVYGQSGRRTTPRTTSQNHVTSITPSEAPHPGTQGRGISFPGNPGNGSSVPANQGGQDALLLPATQKLAELIPSVNALANLLETCGKRLKLKPGKLSPDQAARNLRKTWEELPADREELTAGDLLKALSSEKWTGLSPCVGIRLSNEYRRRMKEELLVALEVRRREEKEARRREEKRAEENSPMFQFKATFKRETCIRIGGCQREELLAFIIWWKLPHHRKHFELLGGESVTCPPPKEFLSEEEIREMCLLYKRVFRSGDFKAVIPKGVNKFHVMAEEEAKRAKALGKDAKESQGLASGASEALASATPTLHGNCGLVGVAPQTSPASARPAEGKMEGLVCRLDPDTIRRQAKETQARLERELGEELD